MIVNQIEFLINNTNNKYIFYKVMYNGIKIGNLYLIKKEKDEDKIKLADIIIFDEYRNLGIGRKLLENAINFVSSIGIKQIYGVMVGDIDRLEKFYQSFGFEISGKNIKLNVINE